METFALGAIGNFQRDGQSLLRGACLLTFSHGANISLWLFRPLSYYTCTMIASYSTRWARIYMPISPVRECAECANRSNEFRSRERKKSFSTFFFFFLLFRTWMCTWHIKGVAYETSDEEGNFIIRRKRRSSYPYQILGGAIPGIFCAFFRWLDRGSLLLDDYVWRTTQYHHRSQNRE